MVKISNTIVNKEKQNKDDIYHNNVVRRGGGGSEYSRNSLYCHWGAQVTCPYGVRKYILVGTWGVYEGQN